MQILNAGVKNFLKKSNDKKAEELAIKILQKCVEESINPDVVILIAFMVVIARGYVGYGIPTSWNKTVVQNIIFFCIRIIIKS